MKAGNALIIASWEHIDPSSGKWTLRSQGGFPASRAGWDAATLHLTKMENRADRRNFALHLSTTFKHLVGSYDEVQQLLEAEWGPRQEELPPLIDYEYLVTVTAETRAGADGVLSGLRGLDAVVDIDYRGEARVQ